MKPRTRNAATNRNDLGRRVICEQFARVAARGCGQFRALWFPLEQRVRFQGERGNRWERLPGGDYEGVIADSIARALHDIRAKRNRFVQVTSQSKPDREVFEVRFPAESLRQHRSQLAKFLEAQLFWD